MIRINKWLAQHTTLSRRKADEAIEDSRVLVNDRPARSGDQIGPKDIVKVDGQVVKVTGEAHVTIMLNKPVGYVCSRDGQGSKTVYELLPREYSRLKVAGRLDKDSSGLLILTTDGELLQRLTHPSHNKLKTYEVTLKKPLTKEDFVWLSKGVRIGDPRPSRLQVQQLNDSTYLVKLTEGRNRQIRRTFEAMHNYVVTLQRTGMDRYNLGGLKPGNFEEIVVK